MIAGQIEYYGLTDWWLSTFTAAEREYIEQVYQPLGGEPGSRPLSQGKISGRTISPAMLFSGLATWFKKPGDRSIVRRILAKAEEVSLTENDLMGLHFTYQQVVQVYYKDREDPAALEIAIDACRKQVAIAPQVAKLFQKEARDLAKHSDERLPESVFNLPTHVGFEQLAIILEKQKDYASAIQICRLAQEQGWAGDWEKRIERCEKKLKKG